ncbi:MAG: calcium-translocating P-type ATPase, SERCA-type [Pelotomaculum sp.]|uniref:P-type Ca(2+) transporter n=1 Tax=Pelotomaculum thermopropionicum (strain DSM 13744 / JCM 10971 / SI) TaxID=370438 RepID=A5D297_PELTS|nr:calcium-translocating P-type ATPase, SERCA-type [Pelotomaculum sp.]BAF59640.1 cation transport ATPase [Pelotomaculum thermopropionicum SI]
MEHLQPEYNWYSLDTDEICQKLGTNTVRGLDLNEAAIRLKNYGPNVLQEKPPRSLLSMFIAQMKEILVVILIAAAVISGFLGEWEDSIVIIAIVILNGAIGTFQENKAENALKALKELTRPFAKVIRGEKVLQINAGEVVPGDLILVEAGDLVPADARLIESSSLQTSEAALTGESLPVEKESAVIKAHQVPLGDRKNMLFMGTTVTGGRGKAVVVATGMKTELGRIAQLLDEAVPETTPLQQQLEKVGKTLGVFALVIVALVFCMGLWRGEYLPEMFMIAISLAVAAVPEGLPAVVTIVLALGVTRMSRRNAIIRKLPAVETLGTATVICSDKTGTLTRNEMTVTRIYVADKIYEVTGNGYVPAGKILEQNGSEVTQLSDDESLELLIAGGLLNNNAELEDTGNGHRVIGDPTEGALVVVAAKAGLSRKTAGKKYPRLAEIPFDSIRKMMTTFHRAEGGIRSFTKGAPDVLLRRCSGVLTRTGIIDLHEETRMKLIKINSQLASQGQRILALATRFWPAMPANLSPETIEQDLVFVGFFAITDPPRPEAREAVELCRRAGIRTVMITGDHRETAEAIARELSILQPGDHILTGEQLDRMSEEELKHAANRVAVYARVSPEHKLRIVEALKHHGHIVAMTGDGVNDAPALKRADIGASMGISGTEVAKEASDMVLLDDNFVTIVKAVEEGRTIYNNIRSSIHYLLSCNAGEIVAIFSSLLLGLGSPLSPIQILWLNLVTDGPPALALGLEPPRKGIMNKPPRKPKESLFSGGVGIKILWQGAIIGLASLVAYWLAFRWGRPLEEARTITFLTMSMSQLIHSFNARSLEQSLFTIGPFSNRSLVLALAASLTALLAVIIVPFLRNVFETAMPRPSDWVVVLSLSIMPLVLVEAGKLAGRLSRHRA